MVIHLAADDKPVTYFGGRTACGAPSVFAVPSWEADKISCKRCQKLVKKITRSV